MSLASAALQENTASTVIVNWGEAAVLAAELWHKVLPIQNTLHDNTFFSLLTQGKNGFLTLDNVVLREGDTFSFKDILTGTLIYYHAEANNEDDALVIGCKQNSMPPVEIALKIAANF